VGTRIPPSLPALDALALQSTAVAKRTFIFGYEGAGDVEDDRVRHGCLAEVSMVLRQASGDPAGWRPRGYQCLALRAVRRDTAVTAESARWSSLAERASRRSAVTARRWTRNRASGSAMAISSHLRSRMDRKTHIFSVPSPRLSAHAPSTGSLSSYPHGPS
jgi:hypothetical protein